jgi:hypothetical protein
MKWGVLTPGGPDVKSGGPQSTGRGCWVMSTLKRFLTVMRCREYLSSGENRAGWAEQVCCPVGSNFCSRGRENSSVHGGGPGSARVGSLWDALLAATQWSTLLRPLTTCPLPYLQRVDPISLLVEVILEKHYSNREPQTSAPSASAASETSRAHQLPSGVAGNLPRGMPGSVVHVARVQIAGRGCSDAVVQW